eukprot:16452170-Heterocapsa_arctica.AAC.1
MSDLRAKRRTFSAPPQGVVSGNRHQTVAAPPALTTPAATRAALLPPACGLQRRDWFGLRPRISG